MLVALLAITAAGSALARPNIVVLLADDWGFTDVGAYGGEIHTPHLDALAHQGMRFTNFHVSASCSPTRAMLLTGVDHHRAGVGNMRETIPRAHVGRPGYLGVLNDRVVTVATLLRDAGYRTLITGKWHVGTEPHNRPDRHGFERSLVQGDSGSDNWDPAQRYLALTDRVQWFEDGRETTMPAEYYSSRFFVDKAIEYLQAGAGSGRPFFAYLGFQSNHIPLQAPQAFIDKYRGRYAKGWTALREARRARAIELGIVPPDTRMVTMRTTADWEALDDAQKAYEQRRMEVYAAMADAMDHEVGRLVAHLKASGEYENTVFVFLSDNGAEASDPYDTWSGRLWLATQYTRAIERLGGKGAYTVIGPSWASAAASPLAGYKFWAGEGGLRVPLIVAGVPGMRTRTIHAGFSHVTDVLPTVLELAGVPRPASPYRGRDIEIPSGRSLVPVLRGEAERTHPPDHPIGYELSGNEALFKGDLKLVRNPPPVGDGRWHLFDIARDPGETRDLATERPEAFRAMLADYETYARTHGVLPMPPGYDPQRQVLINAIANVYLPALRRAAPAIGLALLALGVWVWRRRARRPTRTPPTDPPASEPPG